MEKKTLLEYSFCSFPFFSIPLHRHQQYTASINKYQQQQAASTEEVFHFFSLYLARFPFAINERTSERLFF